MGSQSILQHWRETHDQFIDTILPIVVVYLTLLVAEHYLHESGVTAVMAATMTSVHQQLARNQSYKSQIDGFFNDFWDFLGDLANKILFFIYRCE